MSRDTWSAVDDYLESLAPQDEVLRRVNEAALAAGLPEIQVSATQGRFLELLARIHGAQRVLEFGTLAAYSTICLARGLTGPRPHVTTLEIDPEHARVAEQNIALAGLADVVQVRLGPAARTAAQLVAEGVEPFDLVFIDADKPSNPMYLALALELTRPGAVIVVDNVVRGGAVADATSTDERVQGSRAVIDAAAANPRVRATALQTVGAKGYDGFMLLRVED